jgi:peptide/nickel transport system permease protein
MVTLLMWGARISLVVGFAATFVSMVIGGTIGVAAGYFGGKVDTVLMRITDYFLVIPDVPLMIIVAAIWGPSLFHIVIVIGILLWTSTARVIRAQVKSVRERVYVKRARSLGASHTRVVFRHVLPQVAPLLIANTVLTIAVAIFDETALAFLGLGDPSRISLGKMIENAFQRAAISTGAWWAIVPPGLLVAVIILACSLLGGAIEDALNPRLRVAHLAARTFRLRPLVGRGSEAL